MRQFSTALALLTAAAAPVFAAQDHPTASPIVADDAPRTPGKLRIVENSGECETVPGVYQASGYADIDEENSMWFWFFEARENPETAPLTLWLQGGPGGSSLVGLFQEHGPCRINNDSASVSFNPFSWNNASNMIYVDQPIPTGFSNGTRQLDNSVSAAQDTWQFLQVLFEDSRFGKFQKNDFGIWTESYGGHYGPIFTRYFLDQNARIANGSATGIPINMKNLGMGDALTDPLVQYESYLTYAQFNLYFPTATDETLASVNQSWSEPGGCKDQILQCYNTSGVHDCAVAQLNCDADVYHRLGGSHNANYIPMSVLDSSYPPDVTLYVNDTVRKERIGAVGAFQEVDTGVLLEFQGEWMTNSRPTLESVINDGVRTILYAGDADLQFNYFGIEKMLDQMQTKFSDEWNQQNLSTFNVRGESAGRFKNAGSLSYLRVSGAGHEVPAYKFGSLGTGEAALQMFSQFVKGEQLSST